MPGLFHVAIKNKEASFSRKREKVADRPDEGTAMQMLEVKLLP